MSYALRLDLDRCVGCMACAVACMDQNDLEMAAEPTAWRQVFTVESGAYPEARLRYVSMACMHCEDAPCRVACPTGAISRDAATRAVRVDAAAVHRMPQLFDSLSVRGTALRPGRRRCRNATCAAPALSRVWSRRAFGSARAKRYITETRTRSPSTPRRRRRRDWRGRIASPRRAVTSTRRRVDLETPPIQAWLEEIKRGPDSSRIGMYLVHNGVVRGTSRNGNVRRWAPQCPAFPQRPKETRYIR